MKPRIMLRCVTLAIILLFANFVSAQSTYYRSIASGNWGTFSIWERSTDGITYVPATSGQLPTTNNNVIIQSPHIVTLEAAKNCLNLTINAGGQLTAGATTNQLTVGAGSSGTSGNIGVAQVDGTLGGPGENMVFQLPITAAQVTFTGSGIISIGRIRAAVNNTNYPGSATAGHAEDAKIIVNANMTLNTASNYVIAPMASSQSTTDTITFTLNAGKTITVSSPTAYIHNNTVSSGLVNTTAGKYTYNINGTLDLTANTSTTGGTSFIAFGNAGSSLTLNVGGLLKLGGYFKADTVINSVAGASLSLNILNGGLIDATQTSNLIVGKTGTVVGNIFFVVNGTGALKRTVPGDGTDIKFPVGTNINSYTPAYLSNTGAGDAFTVNVQNTFTNPPPDPNKVVNKQWNITEETPGGTIGTVKLSWIAADQAAGFNPSQTVTILRWTGAVWEPHTATVTGSGTTNDPYVATASGFTAFSPFIVANFSAVPINLSNAKAYTKNNGVQVDWKISNDEDVINYEVERSVDGRTFASAGIVAAQAGTSLKSYSFFDANPNTGTSFYRIKSVNADGSAKYSDIMRVSISSNFGRRRLSTMKPILSIWLRITASASSGSPERRSLTKHS